MDERKWPLPRPTTWKRVLPLFREFHGYGDAGRVGQVWACFEGTKIMAAFTWAPPPPGVALLVSPSCRAGALALSRMVAVPKEEREWHISKPLKWIMKNGIDRERYPVLVTFADTGEGHSGHVYVCSGWQKDGEVTSKRYGDPENLGVRKSIYRGGIRAHDVVFQKETILLRFVHRICPVGMELGYMKKHGWVREGTGKLFPNGKHAFRWVKKPHKGFGL